MTFTKGEIALYLVVICIGSFFVGAGKAMWDNSHRREVRCHTTITRTGTVVVTSTRCY